MGYYLRQIPSPNGDGPIIIKLETHEFLIGRKTPGLNGYSALSKYHALVYKSDDGSISVKDMNSTNGVFVNGEKIGSEHKRLVVGDTIGFGVPSIFFNLNKKTIGFVCEFLDEEVDPEIIVEEVKIINPLNIVIKNEKALRPQAVLNNDEEITIEDVVLSQPKPNEIEKDAKVMLVKVDSEEFQWTPDVKNPFETDRRKSDKHEEPVSRLASDSLSEDDDSLDSSSRSNLNKKGKKSPSLSRSCKKRVRLLSPDSSEDAEEEINSSPSKPLRFKRIKKLPSDSSDESDKGETTSNQLETPENSQRLSNEKSKFSHAPKPSTSASQHPFKEIGNSKSERRRRTSEKCLYSVEEEIIYISDDDSYLDFKSSQKCVNTAAEDIEDIKFDIDMYREIFGGNSDKELSPNRSDATTLYDFNDQEIESIESIQEFVNSTNSILSEMHASDKQPTSISLEVSSDAQKDNDESEKRINSDGRRKETVKSSNSHKDRSSDVDDNSEEERIIFPTVRNDKVSCATYKNTGRVLLTHPKPTSVTEKRSRGRPRKEKLVETKVIDKPSDALKYISSATYQDTGRVLLTDPKPMPLSDKRRRGRPRKETQVENKVIDKPSDAPKNISTASRNASLHVATPETSRSSESSKPLCADEVLKKRKASVKVRPESFSSRGNFLTAETQIKPLKRTQSTSESAPLRIRISKDNFTYKVVSNTSSTGKGTIPVATEIQGQSRLVKNKVINNTTSGGSSLPVEAISARSSLTVKTNSLPSELSFHNLVKSLLELNVVWLKEQTEMKYPPPQVLEGIRTLPLCFTSYESYVSHFHPFIKLEIWEQMFVESKKIYQLKKEYKKFYFSILSMYTRTDCIVLKCESVVNEELFFAPREGMIVILELKENPKKLAPLFGYIAKHSVKPLDLNTLKSTTWKHFSEGRLQDAEQWTFHCCVKQKELPYELNSLMKGNGLCYIRQKLKLADAFCYLKESPLLGDILTPRLPTFKFESSKSIQSKSSSNEYSDRQMTIISGIVDEIIKPVSKSKIILLQGPPGTGKTHVIVGMLRRIFYSNNKSNLKVLVTAPTNVALDEIGRRLVEVDERSQKDRSINISRIGSEKHVNPKMLPYLLDKKAKKLHKRSLKKVKKELKSLDARISELEKESAILTPRLRDQLKSSREACKKKEMEILKQDNNTETKYKIDCLKKSNIILATLSNLSLLQGPFKSHSDSQISCCIIDEATQSSELETLEALKLGISKLILVGDERQLPPLVFSKQSAELGLRRSIFERFSVYFDNIGEISPRVSLVEQFRMHPLICEFPSKYMYDYQLLTHKDRTFMYKDFPLKPLILLNFVQTLSFKVNETLVFTICEFLSKTVDAKSCIGVIVPSDSELSPCAKYLQPLERSNKIEIGTVAAFQGREKDIIILYALKAKTITEEDSFFSCPRRLNVAMTRAKKCLIICVCRGSLIHFQHWKALIGFAEEKKLCFPVSSTKELATTLLLTRCNQKK